VDHHPTVYRSKYLAAIKGVGRPGSRSPADGLNTEAERRRVLELREDDNGRPARAWGRVERAVCFKKTARRD
jgi:hypothetical protein